MSAQDPQESRSRMQVGVPTRRRQRPMGIGAEAARGRGSRLRDLLLLACGVIVGVVLATVSLTRADDLRPPKDPEVLVALAQSLEIEHARVDLLIDQGKIEEAITALDELRAQRWPDPELGGDASILLKHDCYGRLIRLRLDYPEIRPMAADAMLGAIDEALGADAQRLPNNIYTARLYGLRGEVLELLKRDDDALAEYEHALAMHKTLLDELLKEGGK